MRNSIVRSGLRPLETRTVMAGFLLTGIVTVVAAASYLLNITSRPQWLVWALGVTFAAAGILALEWPRSYLSIPHPVPERGFREALLLAMPMTFVLAFPLCGLAFSSRSLACSLINMCLIGLATVTAI